MSQGRRVRRRLAWFVAAVAAAAALDAPSMQSRYDILITGGRVLDGTGAPAVAADVAIAGGRIAAIGPLGDAIADRRVDAAGKLVTPGFIDVHSHAAEGLVREGLEAGRPLLAQGITTIVAQSRRRRADRSRRRSGRRSRREASGRTSRC